MVDVTISKLVAERRLDRFVADNRRVIVQLFAPTSTPRLRSILRRILSMPDEARHGVLSQTLAGFVGRHRDLPGLLMSNFDRLRLRLRRDEQFDMLLHLEGLEPDDKLMVGAFFSLEYSVEAAAFFNPSMVQHPDQSDLPRGSVRFILSFRAVGEGHISSVVFRSGVINAQGHIVFEPVTNYVQTPEVLEDPKYDKYVFGLKLKEMGFYNSVSQGILAPLGNMFGRQEMEARIHRADGAGEGEDFEVTVQAMRWLAECNYELVFNHHRDLSERVLFPVSPQERKGIEDARFVRFVNDDGSTTYYATYTAYDGTTTLPQIIETQDFSTFRIATLNGSAVVGKGFSLFPRRIKGMYYMIGRQDGESLTIMRSDNIHFWHNYRPLWGPVEAWEMVQIGTCGSPIETKRGWLLLTHGVGTMRRYCIGAMLLSLDDPNKVIARLRHPLIEPAEDEREGYVPNVVYSCGGMIHNGELIIPYAMSDTKSSLATVKLDELMNSMTPVR